MRLEILSASRINNEMASHHLSNMTGVVKNILSKVSINLVKSFPFVLSNAFHTSRPIVQGVLIARTRLKGDAISIDNYRET